MLTTNDIRRTFLDYFVSQGHQEVASGPLVPRNDPTLMFTNAGMVQFKNIFTGSESRPYSRAATSQKCVRAGGKHNDLENVGYTARHLTFFEMLGNFSFGDYFKESAISHAWELITRDFGLPKDKLLVTVYAQDDEAAELWRKIAGLPDDKIIRIATSDNFWSMGDTGPCGPCSEIFYDHGDHIPGGPPGSPEEDGDRFIEIWNLVFMQFEQIAQGQRVPLPKPSIDTGMGLERISSVLQGTNDVFETDLFSSLIEASATATASEPKGRHGVSHRVISDHLRSTAFLIADGVLPSNEGRGYVLRRIMRRAMRHAHIVGAREPVIWKMVPQLVGLMGTAFPELGRAEALITETLKLEESRFQDTLDRGLRMLGEQSAKLAEGGVLPGEVAFKLYDTFGFPLDLTEDILRGEGRSVDIAGFEKAMEAQRAAARAAWSGSGEVVTDGLWLGLRDRLGPTEFLGYDSERAEAVVSAVVTGGQEVAEAPAGTRVEFIANQTPFYGESGGQVGDTGRAEGPDGLVLSIGDVKKRAGDVWVHAATVESGVLKLGTVLDLQVDSARRRAIRGHHSATHLLHEALRRRLGEHVTQKGSLVAPDRLRFDISQPRPLSAEDMRAVEAKVNERIRENGEVITRAMTPEAAIEAGAMALFGEKYGETVRVVGMGAQGDGFYSMELCGGTHVRRTGDIGAFKIVSESAVAAGIRRIEALGGEAAVARAAEREALLDQAAGALNVPPVEIGTRLQTLLDERRKLDREVAELRRKLASAAPEGASAPAARHVGGVRFDGRVVQGVSPRDLKPMVDEIKDQIGSGIVTLVAVNDEGRASVVVGVTDDLTHSHDAVMLVRAASQALGGKGGGGRADMAQAGGPQGERAPAALEAVEQAIGLAEIAT